MRLLRNLVLSMMFAVLVAACSQKYESLTPEIQAKMHRDLIAGNLTLDCTVSCMFSWNQKVGSLHALDIAEQWDDLATGVMQIGYRQDLAYYYLGQAAQGLGYHRAAIKYYKYAGALASGMSPMDQCAAKANELADPCQGVDVAAVTPVLIKASQDALDAQAHAAAPVSKKRAPPTGASWAVPPPPSN